MFQYISDILKQFTSQQKMTVLIVLLISIVGITYIQYITKTPDELTKQVSIQRAAIIKDQKYISELSFKINSLNDSILNMNQSCNENAIEREKFYTKKILEQQQYVNSIIDEIKLLINKPVPVRNQEVNLLKYEIDDSIASEPIITTSQGSAPPPENNVNKLILNKLNKLKKRIK